MALEVKLIDSTDTSATLSVTGMVSAANASKLESMVARECAGLELSELTLDCRMLEYISSAGLRVIMKLLRKYSKVSVTNVSAEVYTVFDITGFTQLMNVECA